MIFFSWKKIFRKTGGSSKRIVLVLRALTHKGLPHSVYDPIYSYYYDDFAGDSFLINPYSLLAYDYKYTPKEIAQYIGLASFRNYAHYLATGDSSLDLLHSPVSEDIIRKNRLLSIENGRIHFLYEKSSRRK